MSRTYRRERDEYRGRFDRAPRKSARGGKQTGDDYRDFKRGENEDRPDQLKPPVTDQPDNDEVEDDDS